MRNCRNNKLSFDTVKTMLKNRRYIGEYKYREIVFSDGLPAIISKELFERVQDRLKKNKKAPARFQAEDRYILTTKLYCGKCGAFMAARAVQANQKECIITISV